MPKTLIFVDLDNIYRGMLEHFGLDPIDHNSDLFNTLRNIESEKGNEIVSILAYADYSRIGDRSYRAKLEMQAINCKDVFGANKDLARKNASDVQLSIEAVDSVYNYKDIENYVIVSADSDMIPLIKYLKSKQKLVSLYVLDKQANSDILKLHPNNGFNTIEEILNIKEPAVLTKEEMNKFLPVLITEILQKEEYNRNKSGNRLYQTIDNLKWRVMRFMKIEKRRLCLSNINQTILEAESQGIVQLVYNQAIKNEEIRLNREHELVELLLKKIS